MITFFLNKNIGLHGVRCCESWGDFVNNFSNLDEPWWGEEGAFGGHYDGATVHGSSENVKNRYIYGGNYRKLSQLDQVVLPLHPNRENMTIE